jgi:hypothetical protein
MGRRIIGVEAGNQKAHLVQGGYLHEHTSTACDLITTVAYCCKQHWDAYVTRRHIRVANLILRCCEMLRNALEVADAGVMIGKVVQGRVPCLGCIYLNHHTSRSVQHKG